MREIQTQVVVLGSGPGGYSAAFRAADLKKQVVLIERYENIGGVCLNVGCIPSKALLHCSKLIAEAKQMSAHGVDFGTPTINIDKVREWKESIVKRLTSGLKILAKQRKVEIITGTAKFISARQIEVQTENTATIITFEHAIIAAGSSPVTLPFLPHQDSRVMDSTDALALKEIPKEFLILGGGIIGLEMANVYHALGSKIHIVEMMDQLIPGMDKDIIKPLHLYLNQQYAKIMLETKVTQVEAKADGLWVNFEGKNAPAEPQRFDRILASVGRKPNGKLIGAENAKIAIEARGFIPVDDKLRTNVPHIFAIGDIIGNPMLAHKASHEGRRAAEIIAKMATHTSPTECIPGVAYTDPEVASVGITEAEALQKGIKYGKGTFPWAACGRSLSLGRQEGLTKLIFDPDTRQVIGGSIVGPNAGELIAEVTLAIKMKATAEDLAHTIHAHPTLSETVMMAAEVFAGTATDIFIPEGQRGK
jgi:dihydrolipoamide dehydrogenase